MRRRITHDMPEGERRRWFVVRLDSFMALPGIPLHADVETGNAVMQVRSGDTAIMEEYALGPGGLRIVPR